MSNLVNEHNPLQTNQRTLEKFTNPSKELVRDTKLDLESYRQRVWKHHDKLMHFGGFYGDVKVKPPLSLYYQMEIPETSETLNLKITTSLKRCWGTNCQKRHHPRQTPYVWWLDWYWHKYRICFECMSPLQRHMLSQIYSGNFSPMWIINESGSNGL